MKKTTTVITIFFLAIIAFSSCSKVDSLVAPSTSARIQQGKWKVTLYSEDSVDKTSRFNNYEFSFTGNSITAVKGSTTISGTWSIGMEDDDDDSSEKFIMNFGSIVPFDELNDDWNLVEETSTKLRLEDVSGGHGGTDLLTFEKI
ncbi:MAG: hypothetical protein U0T77_12250 [Chitinophagales bacterium]